MATILNIFNRLTGLHTAGIVVTATLIGCGSSTNILGKLTPHEHFNSFDAELSAAEASYDRGDLETAFIHAQKAYEMKPYSERASILFGFVNLGLAGVSPFSLAIEMNRSESLSAPLYLEKIKSGSDDSLGKFKKTVGITEKETSEIGSLDSSDPDFPVMIPVCAEEARIILKRLQYVTKAIEVTCPFVDPAVRNSSDERQSCQPTESARLESNKAHFLWAFAHLTESLVFNSVLTFGSDTDGKSNLEKRAEKLQQQSSGEEGVSAFLNQLELFQETAEKVMPSSGKCSDEFPTSQLTATMFDLLAVSAGFDRLKGIPPKMTASLGSRLENIQGFGSSAEQLNALKADLSSKIASSLESQINELEGAETISPEEKNRICTSYQSISGVGASGPELCK